MPTYTVTLLDGRGKVKAKTTLSCSQQESCSRINRLMDRYKATGAYAKSLTGGTGVFGRYV